MIRKQQDNTRGFALPAVVIITTVAMIMLASALQTLVAQTQTIAVEYRKGLAADAAEAGLNYASVCLNRTGNTANWASSSDGLLRQNTNCNGEAAPAADAPAADTYVYSKNGASGAIRSRFEVQAPDFNVGSGASLTAIGIVEQLNSSGVVVETMKVSQRKVIIWDSAGNVSGIFTGPGRTCFIRLGKAWCWGRTYHGLLGDGTNIDGVKSVPVPVDQSTGLAGKNVVDIAGGETHTCVLTDDNQVWCWGENYLGQFGNNGSGRSAVPVRTQFPIGGSYYISDIGGWGRGMCAIVHEAIDLGNGKVWCWGDRHWGAVGSGSGTTFSNSGGDGNPSSAQRQPAKIPGDFFFAFNKTLSLTYHAVKLSTSGSQSRSMCVLAKETRTISVNAEPYCWGRNSGAFGVLGRGTTDDNVHVTPQKVTTMNFASYVVATDISIEGNAANPAQVPSGVPTSTNQIASPHVCVRAEVKPGGLFSVPSAAVYCWGNGIQGQIGDGRTGLGSIRQSPYLVHSDALTGNPYMDVEVGLTHSCGRRLDGTVYCWGQHVYNGGGGMIGQNSTAQNYSTPIRVNGDLAGKQVTDISIGANRSCAFGQGFAYCWGRNFAGQIGDGSWCETEYNNYGPNSSQFLQCTREDRFVPTRSRFLEQPVQEYFY